jgi:hypothetical protein
MSSRAPVRKKVRSRQIIPDRWARQMVPKRKTVMHINVGRISHWQEEKKL